MSRKRTKSISIPADRVDPPEAKPHSVPVDELLEGWDGDSERLLGIEEYLAEHSGLCDRIFMSKHEAFVVGLALGERGRADKGGAES